MYLGSRASSTRPPNAIALPCASRIGNITRPRNMSYASLPSLFTSPTLTPASRSPRFSRAFASELGRLDADRARLQVVARHRTIGRVPQHVREKFGGHLARLEHRFALARRGPRDVVLGNRHAVFFRQRAHRFGKGQAFDAHDEIERAAADAAAEAMEKSALGID